MYVSGRKLFSFFLITAFSVIFSVAPVSAYTGTYGILPAPIGGPGTVTVTNYDVDTRSTGIQTIDMGLNYIQSITIETDPGMKSHILIKEYPEGQGKNFDVIVPQPLQNALVRATVTVWAPDNPDMVVEHDHQGSPLAYEYPVKVSPEVTDGNGNVLWTFTVTSFSTFTFMESINDQIKKDAPWLGVNGLMLGIIFGGTIIAPLGFRKNFFA